MKPFQRNILVKPTENKLVIGTPSLREYGEVVAVGDLVKTVKVGQIIAYDRFFLKEVDVDGVTYRVVPENDEVILLIK